MPAGELCEKHGAALEAYPKLKTKEMVNPKFRVGLKDVVKGVEIAEGLFKAKSQSVSMHRSSGLTVSRNVAFVTSSNFDKHFGVQPVDVKASAEVDLSFIPGRTDTKGCVMEVEGLPPKLPYEIVKVWHSIDRTWDTSVLAAQHVFRPGQAKDRYDVSVASMISPRPAVLQTLPGGAPYYKAQMTEAKKVAAQRLLENQNFGGGNEGNVMPDQEAEFVTRSSLIEEEEVDDFGAAVKKKSSKDGKAGSGSIHKVSSSAAAAGPKALAVRRSKKGQDSVLEGFMSSAGSVFDVGPSPAKVRKASSVASCDDAKCLPDDAVRGAQLSSDQERPAQFLARIMRDNYGPGRELGRVPLLNGCE